MRFKLILERIVSQRFIPINYQYELSAAIYRIIHRGDSGFSQFLHEQGYRIGNRSFRLFTFSRIRFDNQRVLPPQGRIEHHGRLAELEVSFLIDRAAEEFIKGVFLGEEIFLGDQISGSRYQIVHVEGCQTPLFKTTMNYRCLSPVFIKVKREDGGENYLDPSHPNYGKILVNNLVSKWMAKSTVVAIGEQEISEDLEFDFQVKGKVYKNGVLIKQMTEQETKLIGYTFEFELTTSPELQEIGYYAGFGQLNSQGFGCVEIKLNEK